MGASKNGRLGHDLERYGTVRFPFPTSDENGVVEIGMQTNQMLR